MDSLSHSICKPGIEICASTASEMTHPENSYCNTSLPPEYVLTEPNDSNKAPE
ncbi:unnamed protein product [Protopolystoma xenopodis]|uniref:Uncharacterized protein n=1 Tax=Protopolystoma xenopodis TaxID=117903 RepID=A0A3S5C1A3_9PLAT|nr:unnamed protein product [Protopolystoma xenopodis]